MMLSRYFIVIFLWFYSMFLYSQDTAKTSIFNPNTNEIISLAQHNNTDEKISITNLNETKINEAPGSVYVVTAEDIEKNGYKDLLDVFINIPGFNVATDVQNGTGLTLRGAWTGEAKLLVMIDGMIMNDMAYGSFVLSGRIPLLNIQRIEIIKGASSTIYGGIAGLGVINIITKSGKTSKGSSFLVDAGMSQNGLSRSRLTFANTTYLLNEFEVSVCGSVFNGNRSNKKFAQADSSITSFKDSSITNNVFVEMKLKRRGFEYKIIYDDYNFQAAHERITSLARTFTNELNLNKKWNKIQLTGILNYKDQIPWNTQYGDPAIYDVQNLKTHRFTSTCIVNYEITNNINLLGGALYYNDYMRYYRKSLILNNGKPNDNFNAFAAFMEATVRTKYFNVYIGERLDYYQTFSPNFSPRISLTKEFKNFNYKIIYGESFKIPTLQNINLSFGNSLGLTPEKMQDMQMELGVKQQKQQFKINGFVTSINNIIVYGYDLINRVESYVNQGNITYAGFELMLNNKIGNFEIKSSYSNYNVLKATSFDYLADTFNLKFGSLAIPKHKIAINVRYQINKKNSIQLNYIYQSKKYAVEKINSISGEMARVEYKPTHLVDLIFQTKSVLKFFDINIGVHNILNVNNYYAYPLASGYPSAIGMGRELFTQLKINL